MICSVIENGQQCDRSVHARGWCMKHYCRWRSHGDPLTLPPVIEQRFWTKVDRNGPISSLLGTQCWIWTAATDPNGYGRFRRDGKNVLPHRYSFEQYVGAVWPYVCHLEIDHRCHNPSCVNPQHLRLVTSKQQKEHRSGAQSNNRSSGVRGVTWDKRRNHWVGQVGHNGQHIHLGRFDTIAEAETTVVAKRLELFTHNDLDRIAQ